MYRIYDLKCNGMVSPRGITDPTPRFSWRLASDQNGANQTGFRVLLWNDDGDLIWDHRDERGEAVRVAYDGEPLEAHRKYTWEVRSESSAGDRAVSERTVFSMGNIHHRWNARWIEAAQVRKPLTDCTEMWKIFAGMVASNPHPEEVLDPAVCMRREFTISKNVRYAAAYATAHGVYDLTVDGTSVSERLAPGITAYAHYLEIQQYDVTDLLTVGSHALGVTLADGWFTGKIGLPGVGNQYGDKNAFFLQIEVFYEDGSRETLTSDERFRWHESPLEYADLIVGERYRQDFLDDAWMRPGFDDSAWPPVDAADYPTDVFQGRAAEPVSVLRRTKPKSILITPREELVVDAGENIVGVLTVRFQGKADTILRMTHSEVLDQDGSFLMNILGQNKNQEDVYVCAHEGEVEWEPRFTFHGFRYVKLSGIVRDQLLDVTVNILGTDLQKTGSFSCSDERLNQLQENIFRSQQGNMLSIPTDCPQRERAGWTGDMQVYAPTACFNMDVESFLRKWLANMRYEQLPDGQIPNIIPSMPSDALVLNSTSKHICSAAWGDACVIVPYTLYRKYGDISILRENFSMMKRWMDYVENQAATSFPKPESEYTPDQLERQRYLWNTEFHFGDWLYPSALRDGMTDPVRTALQTKEYVAPAMFAYTTELMSKVCGALGLAEETERYRELNGKIRAAYAGEYIDRDGTLPLPLQGLYVLALAMKLYPEEKKAAGMARLNALIEENNGCLDTGFASIGFLLDTLWDSGEQELSWQLVFQDKCPSWLYEVGMGATTIWESWNAILPDGTRTNSSYNHFAFGCIGDFLYRKILGLRETEPGYHTVEIRPDLSCGLRHAEGTHITPYGEIAVSWSIGDGMVDLDVTLPPCVSGEVIVSGIRQAISSGSYHWQARL